MTNRWMLTLPLFLCGALVATTARGSLEGTWTLEVTSNLPKSEQTCTFWGTAALTPAIDGEHDLSGPAELALVTGPQGCPASLSGTCGVDVTISEEGVTVSGEIDGGEAFGLATFSGLVVGDPTGTGTMQVTAGPFAGAGGTWTAGLAGVAIPALGAAGLAALMLALAAGGLLLLRRRV